jgi:hypothetical protein
VNSKERIETIFSWDVPDRVGRYEQSVYSSVAGRILGRQAFTGGTSLHRDEAEALLMEGSAHDELIERVYQDRAELGRKLRFDLIGIPWLLPVKPTGKTAENDYLYGDPESEDWVIRRFDPESETFGVVESAHKEETTDDLRRQVDQMEQDIDREPDEKPLWISYLERLVADFGEDLMVAGAGGMAVPLTEPWLIATLTDPGLVAAYVDIQLEQTMRMIRKQSQMGVRVIWGGGDFADNAGPIYGPKTFEEIMLPRWKALMEFCHDPDINVWYVFRSDGDLWSVADMMFDTADIDGYGEIDWEAGMDLGRLKEKYPRVTYWGNVPPEIIRAGTKQKVLDAARHCIDGMHGDRRLILGSSNSILPGSPVENVLALNEAVDLWGVGEA